MTPSIPSRYRVILEILLIFVISALLYLPFVSQFGYYNDDWYSMYAARVAGPGIFTQVYSVDSRPGRALVMIPLYILFKGNPFYYSLSADVLRVFGTLTFLWLLRLMWPGNRRETFAVALLFLAYPGFLSQPIAIDFQSHLFGVWMALLSIALSLKAVFNASGVRRFAWWCGALLTGWLYLSQMEYYIGFEGVRLGIILMMVLRETPGRGGIAKAVRSWLPYIFIPALFLVWRLFVFDAQRPTTDVGLQLGQVLADPVLTLLHWLVYFLQDVANVTLLAWSVPLSQMGFDLRLRDSLIALALSAGVAGLFLLFTYLADRATVEKPSPRSPFLQEGIWLGITWIALGLIPVTFGNRHVVFPDYSRYGFVSAGGAVVFLVALIGHFSDRHLQNAACGLLLVSAAVTHYGNGLSYAKQFSEIRTFWWQVSWRVPQFTRGTTIVAQYPNGGIRESSFVWGPANQIYYPARVEPTAIQTGIYAILLDHDAVINILNRKSNQSDRYGIVETYPDYAHILILAQPNPQSCVQVIDGSEPEYSRFDDDAILSIGSHSEMDHIQTRTAFHTPPAFLFGEEPAHKWCYYYEKAAFARQTGDWEEVLRLAQKTAELGYRPDDLIEWMPFLQAYAWSGDADKLAAESRAIWSDEYVAHQACQILGGMQGLTEDVRAVIESQYCKKP